MFYKIEIYTRRNCPYCDKAKEFFIKKSLNFKEIVVGNDFENIKYLEMYNRSKGRVTVPQIFINNQHIGGSDDLMKINDTPEQLNNLLRSRYLME